MKEFKKYNDFFKFYLSVLDENVPQWSAYMTMKSSLGGHQKIHREMPKLKNSQVKELNTKLRELVKFPKKVMLSYQSKTETWYAGWRPDKGAYQIAYPTLAYYWMAYPSLLKTALLHELGHIFNGDSNVKNRAGHSSCLNICMDVRCNAPLDRLSLMQVNDCLFHFKIKRPQGLYVPEQFYPQVGLPVLPQGYSFEVTHNAYHQKDFEDDDEKDPQKLAPWVPQIGDYVIITAGKSSGRIATIEDIMPNQECSDFYDLIDSMDKEAMIYNEDIDYSVIQRCEYVLEGVSEIDEEIYSKKITPSEAYEKIFAGSYSGISSSGKKYGIYKRIDFALAEPLEEAPPVVECECLDSKGNPTGDKSSECCPKPPPPPEPPPIQVGDLVAVKGGKYGKVVEMSGDENKKFKVEEVSVEVVNATLGTKLK